MIPYTPPQAAQFIPVIDLAPSFSADLEDRKAVAFEIHKAARDTGFFYISNHGIPSDILEAHLDYARAFFALPFDAKNSINGTGGYGIRGYEPMGAQILDEGAPPDLKEAFQMGVEIDRDHPWYSITGQEVMNRWPDQPQGFQAHFEDYAKRLTHLGQHMMRLLALSLNLEEDYFDAGMKQPSMTSRLIHYPPQPKATNVNQIGAGAHTDWGTLTFLLQDDVGGLEVENADGEWIEALPIQGTFVVNLGDMIPVLTNGIYHSNMHRVRNGSAGRHRYSAPTFIDPSYTYVAECVPTCLPNDRKPKFPPVTVIEHTSQKYYESYAEPSKDEIASDTLSAEDHLFLRRAVEMAKEGVAEGGHAIGAVLAKNGQKIAESANTNVQTNDPTAHAEIACLRKASAEEIAGATLYTTLSPCIMCTGAMLWLGVERVVIGDCDHFSGNEEMLRSHGVIVIEANDEASFKLLEDHPMA